MSYDQIIAHIVDFISLLWQNHPFREGNTRATAVFIIKYLRSCGFKVNNDLFANNSWYFRNALVRANYRNPSRNIEPDKSFLTLFFRNLILGEQNELKNRYMLIGYIGDTPTSTEQVQVGGNQFITDKENIKRLIVVVGEQKMSVKEMMEATGLKDSIVKNTNYHEFL